MCDEGTLRLAYASTRVDAAAPNAKVEFLSSNLNLSARMTFSIYKHLSTETGFPMYERSFQYLASANRGAARIATLPLRLVFCLLVVWLGLASFRGNDSAAAADRPDQTPAATCVIESKSIASRKALDATLPMIGVIVFDDVLMTEVTAPIDVFSKPTADGKQLFNVFTVGLTMQPIMTESGLRILPDYTFASSPKLDVLVVPSTYDMTATVKDDRIVNFIKQQNSNTQFTMSNCAGAQLIGESGIAAGKKIVTYIGGGKDLQQSYPELKVQDDAAVSFVEDGKFLSSNGNLASYISALKLLEKMSNQEHRSFVESYLYIDRLKNWNQ